MKIYWNETMRFHSKVKRIKYWIEFYLSLPIYLFLSSNWAAFNSVTARNLKIWSFLCIILKRKLQILRGTINSNLLRISIILANVTGMNKNLGLSYVLTDSSCLSGWTHPSYRFTDPSPPNPHFRANFFSLLIL